MQEVYDTRLIFDLWFSQEVDRLVWALIILIPFSLASNRTLGDRVSLASAPGLCFGLVFLCAD